MKFKNKNVCKGFLLCLILTVGFMITGTSVQAGKDNANVRIKTTQYRLKNKAKRCPIIFKKNETYRFRNMNTKVVHCKWASGYTRLSNGWWKTSVLLTPVRAGATKVYIEKNNGKRVAALDVTVTKKMDVQETIEERGSIYKGYKRIAYVLGVKEKKNSNFPTYYAASNNIVLGMDKKEGDPYEYVLNKGNKFLTIFGIGIGDSYRTAEKKLNKVSSEAEITLDDGSRIDGKYIYKIGETGKFQMTVKNGKISFYCYESYLKS